MTGAADDRLAEARARDIGGLIDALELSGLKRAGREFTGPCPQCGGDDRFSINTAKGVFQCRRCGAKGDGIALVRFVRGLSLPAALDWLCGPVQELTPAERAERDRKAAENAAAKAEAEARARARARADAWAVWQAGRDAEGTDVRGYLRLRGIPDDAFTVLAPALRFHPDLPYMEQIGRDWVELHRGPAMLAAIQGRDGRFIGCHRTWVDVARPKGKPLILHPGTGKALKVKKSLGSVKGGSVRLVTPRAPWDVLVMGEGNETTLSALVHGGLAGAAFWAGVSLGNICGGRVPVPGRRSSDLPDLSDADAFVPPAHVRRLVLIQDGDSEPDSTRAKLVAGARRAMALVPGLRAQIVPCPAGADLNDVIMGAVE